VVFIQLICSNANGANERSQVHFQDCVIIGSEPIASRERGSINDSHAKNTGQSKQPSSYGHPLASSKQSSRAEAEHRSGRNAALEGAGFRCSISSLHQYPKCSSVDLTTARAVRNDF